MAYLNILIIIIQTYYITKQLHIPNDLNNLSKKKTRTQTSFTSIFKFIYLLSLILIKVQKNQHQQFYYYLTKARFECRARQQKYYQNNSQKSTC